MRLSRIFGFALTLVMIALLVAVPVARADVDWPIIKYGETVKGEITDSNISMEWRFEAKKGDVISVTMTATSGDLEPLISIGYLEPSDTAVDHVEPMLLDNGDVGGDTSTFKDFVIPDDVPDTVEYYYILASRAGVSHGKTEGKFSLTLERGNAESIESTSESTSESTGEASTTDENSDLILIVPTIEATQGAEDESVCVGLSEQELTPNKRSAKQQWDKPEQVIDEESQYCAVLDTSKGKIVIELYPKNAPKHVNSFVFLAINGYYDGVPWHRVIPDFVAQTGDPTGTGTGGPGYQIPLEANSELKLQYDREGRVGMARTVDPNSAGSQFFITYSVLHSLDPDGEGAGYTIFGQVVEGMDVAKELKAYEAGTNEDGKPDTLDGVYIFEIKSDK